MSQHCDSCHIDDRSCAGVEVVLRNHFFFKHLLPKLLVLLMHFLSSAFFLLAALWSWELLSCRVGEMKHLED